MPKKPNLRSKNDGVYLSDVSNQDKPWDTHRANSDLVRNIYHHLGYDRYPERINDCSRLLEFTLKRDFDQKSMFKLKTAKFCRVRWCPVCQWRRTLMWRSRFYKVIPAIKSDHPKVNFLFLTLTVKNCELNELRDTINWMHKSWLKLVKRKRFPALGWLKATEITKGKDGKAHPHFHCILLVNSSYFKNKEYVTQSEWKDLWRESLKADYDPSVNIQKVKLLKSRQKKLSKHLGRELTDNDITFYGLMECLKYSVKEFDLISDPNFLDSITKQLHKTRAIASGGLFKDYLSDDEPEDLVNVELEQNLEAMEAEARFLFGWKETIGRYQSL